VLAKPIALYRVAGNPAMNVQSRLRASRCLAAAHTGGLVASCCSFCCTCGRLSGLDAFCAFLAFPLSLPFDRSPMTGAPYLLVANPIAGHYTPSAPPTAAPEDDGPSVSGRLDRVSETRVAVIGHTVCP
jgi:hypothetical protein